MNPCLALSLRVPLTQSGSVVRVLLHTLVAASANCIHGARSPCQHIGNPLVKMATWMEDDDASELQDYLHGFHSQSKGGDVDWKTIMDGGSVLVIDRTGARGLGGQSKPAQVEGKGGSRFLKGKSTIAKGKNETKSDLVFSTALPTKEFLKSNAMSPASDCSRRLSSSASSRLSFSDEQLSEREKRPLARVASIAHTSLHSDVSSVESAKNTQSSITSDHASPPPTVAVKLPRVQFAADLTSSPSSTTVDLVATTNSVSEQPSTVATEARGEAPRPRQDGSQASGEEEGGYGDDTFEDVSVIDDSEVEYRTDSHESNLVEHDYGESDFEEGSVASCSSKDSGEEENENEDDNGDDDRMSIDDCSSSKEVSHSVVIEQSKNVPSVPPLTKVSQYTCVYCA